MNLCIDSRNRINTSDAPNTCTFLLQQGIFMNRFELQHFTFANRMENVTSGKNTLFLNGVLAATIQAKFWNALDFVENINNQLKVFLASATDIVTLNADNNTLTWSLNSATITNSPLKSVLGIIGQPTGSFITNLFLVGTVSIGFSSPQLSNYSLNTTLGPDVSNTAIISFVIPVESGFLQVQTYKSKRGCVLQFDTKTSFNVLQVYLTDVNSNTAINIGEWSCNFLVS